MLGGGVMKRAALASVVVTAMAGGVLAAPSAGAAGPDHASVTTEIRCVMDILHRPTTWWFPKGQPRALIWLQHGFARSNQNMADLAGVLAQDGYLVFAPTLATVNPLGCTVQNLNNADFMHNVADLFGKKDRADKLSTSLAKAAVKVSRAGLDMPTKMVFIGHSAGGEAVAYVGAQLVKDYPGQAPNLMGEVLLDPVPSPVGSHLATGAKGLAAAGKPIRLVAAAPGTCNSDGEGPEVLASTLTGFLGLRLTTGKHTDAEGASTDWIGRVACGTPAPANVTALQTLVRAWTDDLVDGTRSAAYYPGGSYLTSLQQSGAASVLSGSTEGGDNAITIKRFPRTVQVTRGGRAQVRLSLSNPTGTTLLRTHLVATSHGDRVKGRRAVRLAPGRWRMKGVVISRSTQGRKTTATRSAVIRVVGHAQNRL